MLKFVVFESGMKPQSTGDLMSQEEGSVFQQTANGFKHLMPPYAFAEPA
jgi:hypothetical protein